MLGTIDRVIEVPNYFSMRTRSIQSSTKSANQVYNIATYLLVQVEYPKVSPPLPISATRKSHMYLYIFKK